MDPLFGSQIHFKLQTKKAEANRFGGKQLASCNYRWINRLFK